MNRRWKAGALAIVGLVATGATMMACSDDSTAPAPRTATYVANLSTANEVPPVTGNATGTATFTLVGNTISYTVTVNGLSANAAASHIHFGGAGINGNIAYPFNAAAIQSGQLASGTIDLTQPVSNGTTSITGDSLLTLLNNGMSYVNVHTPNNAGGEMRGQITRVTSSSSYGY